MLKIDLKPSESLRIGDAIVTLESKSGQVARLAVQAPKAIAVQRVAPQTSVVQIAAQQGLSRS